MPCDLQPILCFDIISWSKCHSLSPILSSTGLNIRLKKCNQSLNFQFCPSMTISERDCLARKGSKPMFRSSIDNPTKGKIGRIPRRHPVNLEITEEIISQRQVHRK